MTDGGLPPGVPGSPQDPFGGLPPGVPGSPENPFGPGGMFPPPGPAHRPGKRMYPRRRYTGPALIAVWVVRIAFLAFFAYVAIRVFTGVLSTPSP